MCRRALKCTAQSALIIDGAHNPRARARSDALTLLEDQPVTGVIGVLADKDSTGLLRALAPRLARVLSCQARARSVRMSWLCALTRVEAARFGGTQY